MRVLDGGRSLLTWATILTVLATAGSVLSGCSLRPIDQHVLRVEFPADALPPAPASLRSSGPENPLFREPTPTSHAEFRCFALNVTGPGILPHPHMPCRQGGDYIGRVGGFVPVAATGTVLEVTVPTGPSRRVQVIAATSRDGVCPNLDQMFAAEFRGESDGSGLGDPYVVGDATVDVYADRSLEIIAKFDPETATPSFQGCGDGYYSIDVPDFRAYKGSIAAPWDATNPPPSGDGTNTYSFPAPNSTPLPVFRDFAKDVSVTPQELTATEYAAIRQFESIEPGQSVIPSTTNSAIHSVRGVDEDRGAAIQIQWDVTYQDLVQYPFAEIELQMTGGGVPNTNITGCAELEWARSSSAVVHSRTTGDPFFGSSRHGESLQWVRLSLKASDVILEKEGKRWIIATVYSDFYSKYCFSRAAVGGARLKLRSIPQPLRLESQQGSSVYSGSSIWLSAQGGVGPYLIERVGMASNPTKFSSWHYYVRPEDQAQGMVRFRLTDRNGAQAYLERPVIASPISISGQYSAFADACAQFTISAPAFTDGHPTRLHFGMNSSGEVFISQEACLSEYGGGQYETYVPAGGVLDVFVRPFYVMQNPALARLQVWSESFGGAGIDFHVIRPSSLRIVDHGSESNLCTKLTAQLMHDFTVIPGPRYGAYVHLVSMDENDFNAYSDLASCESAAMSPPYLMIQSGEEHSNEFYVRKTGAGSTLSSSYFVLDPSSLSSEEVILETTFEP